MAFHKEKEIAFNIFFKFCSKYIEVVAKKHAASVLKINKFWMLQFLILNITISNATVQVSFQYWIEKIPSMSIYSMKQNLRHTTRTF